MAQKGLVEITVRVNGRVVTREVEPRKLLVSFIRDDLGLTGTHWGCDTGNCGACTVIMNGRSVKSCNVLAVQADGAELLTIEGLAGDGKLHPIQEAFWENHALQCGFCTPGFIMQTYWLLKQKPRPSPEEVRKMLAGNLCRCTGYQNIVKAVLAASAKMRRWVRVAVTAIFGARVKRREDPRLITGQGRFTDDIRLPGMCYAVFVRSPYAHAKISRVDVSKALKAGALAALTGGDLDGKVGPVPCAWVITNAEIRVPTYRPLAIEKVRYVGDPVAVVVGESPEKAYDYAKLVEVEYAPLPAVVDQEEAMRSGAPQLYDDVPNNISFTWWLSGGDIEKAFSEADIVIEKRLVNHRLQPAAMETRGVVAAYDTASDSITAWITSQNPHIHRFLISAMTGIPEHKIRVIATDVGGGFGSKIHVYGPEAVVTYLSKTLGLPVKWMESRRENFLATIHGRDHVQYVKLAAKKDGTMLGLEVRSIANLGAYLSTAAPGIPTWLFGLMLSGPYRIPAIKCEVVGVLTNTAPVDAYRGAGRPEATHLLERMVDVLARRLGIDPAEVRRRNFLKKEEFPYQSVTGILYDSGDYQTAFNKALEKIGYIEFRRK